ncbi:hypothetical protein ACWD95_45230, partial [Streptomyces sp. NPDC005069]
GIHAKSYSSLDPSRVEPNEQICAYTNHDRSCTRIDTTLAVIFCASGAGVTAKSASVFAAHPPGTPPKHAGPGISAARRHALRETWPRNERLSGRLIGVAI